MMQKSTMLGRHDFFQNVKPVKSKKIIILLLFTGLLAACGSPKSSGPKIQVENVWSRPAVAIKDEMGGMGVVYLTLINQGDAPDRLVSVQSEVAEAVEIHSAKRQGDRMMMKPVEGGVEIPAKGRVEFKTGGYHLMLVRLKHDLRVGDRFKVLLKFEKSKALTVESEVHQS